MIGKKRIIVCSFTFLVTILILLSYALSGNAQTLYSCNSPGGGAGTNAFLHTIDPDTGATLSTTDITLEGEELIGCNGLAQDPTTGVCWIILSGPGSGGGSPGPRLLATLNPRTGRATEIGNTGLAFAGIAFDTSGILYGLTGDQGESAIPTIYMLSKDDGAPTFFQALVNSGVGEALGFNPNDGLLYRMDAVVGFQVFESINPNNMVVTQIILSGDEIRETTALTHLSGNVLLAADELEDLYSLGTSGVVTFIGDMDHKSKGLAFGCAEPEPPPTFINIPTLSQWGLIAMAGVLGIAGYMVIRRRKVTA